MEGGVTRKNKYSRFKCPLWPPYKLLTYSRIRLENGERVEECLFSDTAINGDKSRQKININSKKFIAFRRQMENNYLNIIKQQTTLTNKS